MFNRKTFKIYYCCTPNIKAIINGHNKRLLNKKPTRLPHATAGRITTAQLRESVNLKNIIYRATVTSGSNDVKQYIDSTSRNFKRRLYEHRASFPSNTRLVKPKNCTELANYIWKLIRIHSTTSSGKSFTITQPATIRSDYVPCAT